MIYMCRFWGFLGILSPYWLCGRLEKFTNECKRTHKAIVKLSATDLFEPVQNEGRPEIEGTNHHAHSPF